jgi:CheY-like chemotaxis protein
MGPHTPWRILVIDDEPGLVHALTRLLQRDGYVVETAGNGRAGLAALQAQRFDVILCDVRMPDLDGRAFYAHLWQRAPTLCQRVIFLTGDSSAADHQAFFTQCGRPWLDKPCPIDAIRRAIAQVLERVMRAQQLSRTCRELRQRSHVLLGKVQTLRTQSAHLRCQAALLRGQAPRMDMVFSMPPLSQQGPHAPFSVKLSKNPSTCR